MIGRLGELLTGYRARARHLRLCRAVLNTPPLAVIDAPLRLLSMVCHRDVLPYLVAVKSVYRRIGEGRVTIVDDGTLTPADRALLTRHLGQPEILPIKAIDTGPCPRGGTWERLLAILDRLRDAYVIQVDADTVATGPLTTVLDCYRANRAFTLGTPSGTAPVSLTEAAATARRKLAESPAHVQLLAESRLDRLAEPDRRRYVRGSSGFAGFARGGASRRDAEAFSSEIAPLVGGRWSEWGTEQVTSNFIVANMPGAVVLPQPDYACFQGTGDGGDSVFLHFYGTYRYAGGAYGAATRRALTAIR